MRAAILAGGAGTRLSPYTTVLPKPLVPIGEQPILELIVRQLARDGFTEIDFLVGHLGELIRVYFDQGASVPKDMRFRYHWEDAPLGTAGALHQIDPLTGPLLVMNGDILTTLDYGELVRFHTAQDAALTIATHAKRVQLALGVVEGNGELVDGYVEKPTLSYEVSMGIYVYTPRALEHVPPGRFDFPDVVLALIDAGERVARFHFDGPWFDIGTRDEHEQAVEAYEADPAAFDA
jgi:NDP-sugar pyrophosphorylase family protein